MGLNPTHSSYIPLFIVLLFAIINSTSAYNITYFLSNNPEFSNFNDLLTKTGVAKAINNLKSTITVLAVDNSAVGALSGQSQSSQQAMLAAHVLLDYFDTEKLRELKAPRTVTNLYQKTGRSSGQQGSTSITKRGGNFIFYSSVNGAPKSSKFVKEVGSKPFDIIVLQISTPVVVPGLNSTPIASPPEVPPSPAAAPPKSSGAPAPAPVDDGEVADGPEADSPSAAASSPAPSPSLPPEDAPSDDEPPTKPASKNGGGRIMANVGGLVVGFLALVL